MPTDYSSAIEPSPKIGLNTRDLNTHELPGRGPQNGEGALLPAGSLAFLRRFAIRLTAGAVSLLGFLVLLSLWSYHPADPSFNTVGQVDAAVGNWLGLPGSYTADIFFQLFGFGSFAPALILFLWGGKIAFGLSVSYPRTRLLCLLFALAVLCAVLSLISAFLVDSTHFYVSAGGGVGRAGVTNLATLLALFPGPPLLLDNYWQMGFMSLLMLLAGLCFLTAVGLSFSEWRFILSKSRHGFSALLLWRHKLRRLPGPDFRAPNIVTPGHDDFSLEETDDPLFPESSDLEQPDAPDTSPDTSEDSIFSRPALKPSKRKVKKPPPVTKVQADQASLPLDSGYNSPGLDLLTPAPAQDVPPADHAVMLEQNARQLEAVLSDFGVRGEIVEIKPGPVVTLYALEPAPGIKSSRVIGLADDIARSMAALSVRIATIPGVNAIGIELPNATRETVVLRALMGSGAYTKSRARLPLILGKDIAGEPEIVDLAIMPHLLIAGTTGSGKSVGLNAMILSLLYRLTPDQCRFIMVDPKMLELSVYNDIPHLLSPVVTDPKKAVVALKWVVREMEDRYRAISRLGGVRNIDGYNKRLADALQNGETLTRKIAIGIDAETGQPITEEQELPLEPMPYIVVVVDEMADLMLVAGKDIEASIQRLAQMARAAGIHIIMATQRPSVDVITGTIKANFPTRISFSVTSKFDSRTVLGEQGAEQLLGKGDMLYMAGGGRISRIHGPFVDDAEVEAVCDFLRSQGTPTYVSAVTDAEEMSGGFDTDVSGAGNLAFLEGGGGDGNGEASLYDQAVAIVAREGKCSTSFLQRQMKIGYNRAADLVDRMEKEGVVSAANHAGKREVMVGDHSTDSLARKSA